MFCTDAVRRFYFAKQGGLPSLRSAENYYHEEHVELQDAFTDYWRAKNDVERGVYRLPLAKEIGDALFTLYGLALAAGIDGDVAFELVAASNMNKEPTAAGKIRKGADYQTPDMTKAIL